MKSSSASSKLQDENIINPVNKSSKWGQIKLDRLPSEFDTTRLKQEKPILIDQPLLPSSLSPDANSRSGAKKRQETATNSTIIKKSNAVSRIDSYIINTIRLNQILKNRVPFDQVDLFKRSTSLKTEPSSNNGKSKSNSRSKSRSVRRGLVIETNEQAHVYLKQFITIMCLHIDFTEISSIAIDILVDLLEHFLESFFKIMKNLKTMNLFDVQDVNNKSLAGAPANFYNNEIYVEQTLQELGLGSIKDLKDYYLNDILLYYRTTYDRVNRMYDAYKRGKQKLLDGETSKSEDANRDIDEHENAQTELEMDEFMKNNELLNDESNLMLGEFLNDLNSSHLDEEMNKLLQMIGPDPFCLGPDTT